MEPDYRLMEQRRLEILGQIKRDRQFRKELNTTDEGMYSFCSGSILDQVKRNFREVILQEKLARNQISQEEASLRTLPPTSEVPN